MQNSSFGNDPGGNRGLRCFAALAILSMAGPASAQVFHIGTSKPKPAQQQQPASAPRSNAAPASTAAAPTKTGPTYAAVVDRFPELKEADVLDLAKVKSAIERATPDMFYTAVDTPAPTYANYSYLPSGEEKPGDKDAATNDPSAGTEKRPYAVAWAQGDLYLAQRETLPSRLAPNTPVLIWSIKYTEGAAHQPYGALVVTLDGGRYTTRKYPLPVQPGLAAQLPAPAQHEVLTANQVRVLEKASQLPAGTADRIETARTAGTTCSDKLWTAHYAAKQTANEHSALTRFERDNKLAQIRQEWWTKTATACGKQSAAFQKELFGAIEARKKARLALYESVLPGVKERAAALGGSSAGAATP